MAATKIDGTAIARRVRERLQAEIAEKKAINPRFQPNLKIIQGALHILSPEKNPSCVTNRRLPPQWVTAPTPVSTTHRYPIMTLGRSPG
jgi:hypothetical protein